MEAMKQIPDKFFQLAITDPPYGLGIDGQKRKIGKNPKQNRKQHTQKDWDSRGIPGAEYFRELERISENQIIWGGNYFVEHLNTGHKGWIVWDKGQHGLTMSDCELAYTSFDCPTNLINADIKKQLDELQKEVTEFKVDSWRTEILDFSDSCMNHRRHTKEQFDHVIETLNKYEKYITENSLTNGQVDVAHEYILEIYKRCIRENDFALDEKEEEARKDAAREARNSRNGGKEK